MTLPDQQIAAIGLSAHSQLALIRYIMEHGDLSFSAGEAKVNEGLDLIEADLRDENARVQGGWTEAYRQAEAW